MTYVKFLAIALIVSSCATKTAFTSDIQKEQNFPESKLKRIQFYTSGEIVLSQVKTDGYNSISDGKVLIKSTKNNSKIIIKKNTPCILEQVIDQNKFLFSFEVGDEKVLLFGNNSSGYYSLMAKEWKNKVAIISYSGANYTTTNGDVYLSVKVKNLRQLRQRQRIAKGRKI